MQKSRKLRKSKSMRKSRYRTHREGGGWFTSKYDSTQRKMLKPIRKKIKFTEYSYQEYMKMYVKSIDEGLVNKGWDDIMLKSGFIMRILRIVEQCIKQKNYTEGALSISSDNYKKIVNSAMHEQLQSLHSLTKKMLEDPNNTELKWKHLYCSSVIPDNIKNLILNNNENSQQIKEMDKEDNINKCKSEIDNSREIKEIYELLLVDPSKLVLNKDVGVADADDEDDVEDDDDEDDGSDASHHDNT